MRLLLIPIILISFSVSAQKKNNEPEKKKTEKFKIPRDTLSILKENESTQKAKMYIAEPKGSYSGLKENSKDVSKYKILNATPPKKEENKNETNSKP